MSKFTLTVIVKDGIVDVSGNTDFDLSDENITEDDKIALLYSNVFATVVEKIKNVAEEKEESYEPTNPELH